MAVLFRWLPVAIALSRMDGEQILLNITRTNEVLWDSPESDPDIEPDELMWDYCLPVTREYYRRSYVLQDNPDYLPSNVRYAHSEILVGYLVEPASAMLVKVSLPSTVWPRFD
jgi:hypothetical protein